MDEINLHFTGDFHAVTSANNALMALVDNHIYQGNELNIDPRRMTFKRVLDMNDRSLREVVIGLGGPDPGRPARRTASTSPWPRRSWRCSASPRTWRTSASGWAGSLSATPTTAARHGGGPRRPGRADHAAQGRHQAEPGADHRRHAGPGPRRAVRQHRARLQLADRHPDRPPAGGHRGHRGRLRRRPGRGEVHGHQGPRRRRRAVRRRGGGHRPGAEDARRRGQGPAEGTRTSRRCRPASPTSERHVRNVEKFGVTPVVAINKFASDTQEELDWLLEWCAGEGRPGRRGGCLGPRRRRRRRATNWRPRWRRPSPRRSTFRHLYPLDLSVEEKIRTIVQEIYGADGVDFSVPALKRLADIEKNGWTGLPVCMAKTQYSFSDDASRLGAPKGFTVHVRDLIPKTGAGFIVALTGAVMTMPGLPAAPGRDAHGRGRRRQPGRPLLNAPSPPAPRHRRSLTSGATSTDAPSHPAPRQPSLPHVGRHVRARPSESALAATGRSGTSVDNSCTVIQMGSQFQHENSNGASRSTRCSTLHNRCCQVFGSAKNEAQTVRH